MYLEELGTVLKDPYYDIHGVGHVLEDSDIYCHLLELAHERNYELFAILYVFRGTGVVLVPSPAHKYKLKPIIDPDKGWSSLDEYNAEKQYLVPYAAELADLIKQL